jgi:hypothetical protein|tara:strand:+ start:280 stop:627 length:348 start_codon:yes stop_codon:yes gene_type:complete
MQMIRKIIPLALVMVLVNLVSPWWGFTVLAMGSPWLCNGLKDSMLISARASVLSWVPLLIYSYINGGVILFDRVSQMMGLPNPFLLILSSGILAALLGAFAGLSGYYVKEVFDDN